MPMKYDKLFRRMEAMKITTYTLRKKNIISQRAWQTIKTGQGYISTKTLERLCEGLYCQPGDIMEYVTEPAPRPSSQL